MEYLHPEIFFESRFSYASLASGSLVSCYFFLASGIIWSWNMFLPYFLPFLTNFITSVVNLSHYFRISNSRCVHFNCAKQLFCSDCCGKCHYWSHIVLHILIVFLHLYMFVFSC